MTAVDEETIEETETVEDGDDLTTEPVEMPEEEAEGDEDEGQESEPAPDETPVEEETTSDVDDAAYLSEQEIEKRLTKVYNENERHRK